MAKAKGSRTGRKKTFLVLCAVVGALFLLSFVSGACKDNKQAGKDARQTFEKSKEALKEGLDKTGEAAKKGLEKGGEAAKEGLDKTKEAAKEFSKGWSEGGKK